MQIDNLSPSGMIKYDRVCPKMFQLKKLHASAIQVENAKRDYGDSIHRIIKNYYNSLPEGRITADEIEIAIEVAFEEGKTLAMKHKEQNTNKIKANFIAFEKQRLKTFKVFKPTFVEKWLACRPFPDLLGADGQPIEIRIIVDAYWQEDKIGYDWKTGGCNPDDNLIQGKTNQITLEANNFPCTKFRFFQLVFNTDHQIPNVENSFIKNIVINILESARTNNFPKRPSGLCDGWCEYMLNCQLEGRCLWL